MGASLYQTPPAFTGGALFLRGVFTRVLLARSHTDGTVEAHVFTVEITGFDHAQRQLRIFIRLTQTFRERHGCRQCVTDFLRRTGEQWRIENALQDRVDANAIGHQTARDRKRHANHAAFSSGISRPTHLAIFGSNRSGVDHRPALAIFVQRIKRQHTRGRLGNAAESADQIDLNDKVESIHREVADRAVFAVALGGLDRVTNTGTVDQYTFLTIGGARFFKTGVHAGIVGYVDLAENTAQFS